MKIFTVVGARPQFIKAAALSRVLRREPGIQEVLLHTGQHYDANMSEIFFKQMDIPAPDYNLEIAGLAHGAMTGRMLEKIEQVLLEEKPDRVLVYGDTNSTLAAGLAAAKLHIPVAHVEAGLRSFNMAMPEEINRILVDRLSDKLFCPTETAVKNLHNEGFARFTQIEVVQSGDIMQDAALYYAQRAKPPELPDGIEISDDPFVLVTLHRAENTDDPLRLHAIWNALLSLSEQTPCLFPIHPRTRKKIKELNIDINHCTKNSCQLYLIPPVGYLEMVYLLQHCSLVLTDSGGLQKEAFFFQKPCVTLRDETEWVELVDNGFNYLAGSDTQRILEAATVMQRTVVVDEDDMYGGGRAASNIVSSLLQ
jgi:UDP-GlcNAc3NAcA epimerase